MKQAALPVLLVLAGCARPVPALQPQTVLAAPADYQGKRIVVRGYLRYGDDSRSLWQSIETYRASRSAARTACLTLFNADAFHTRLRQFADSTVTLTGTVRTMHLAPEQSALGWCNDTGLMIERIE